MTKEATVYAMKSDITTLGAVICYLFYINATTPLNTIIGFVFMLILAGLTIKYNIREHNLFKKIDDKVKSLSEKYGHKE